MRVQSAGSTEALPPSGSLAALREAVESGRTVLIAYVDNHGTATERLVDPVRVDGGWLTARDHRADDVRQFAVHRIRSVHPVADSDRGPDAGRSGKSAGASP